MSDQITTKRGRSPTTLATVHGRQTCAAWKKNMRRAAISARRLFAAAVLRRRG
ncbi:hypothetical protein ES332_D11G238600v1 [Gossypium tomentosum]|uniref:Uncharacterized protein n=1 Tax=Gossypium tomentosum TaxID=34277 RepID=A0A5D2IRY9_GOSTO|nr:hypothetical protein ES332_D11G238600v1 [Gossypium tomentosum]